MILGLISTTMTNVYAEEQTLVVALMKYIKNPNPMKQETWYDWWLNLVIYERLFRIGTDLEPKPWLCVSYDVSPDGLIWTFKIVDNAVWHDDVPLTVKDIAFTIEFFKKYKPPDWYPDVMYIEKTEIVDDYTIKIYLNQTFVWLIRRFGTMIILPEHVWKHVEKAYPEDPVRFNPMRTEDVRKVLDIIMEEAESGVASKVSDFVEKYGHLRIGAGPFIIAGWKEGEYLEMVKHPKYFKTGYPKVDKLVYKVLADPQTEYLAVKKGEVHIMCWTLPYAVIEEAEKDPNIIVPRTPDTYYGLIGLNMKDPILSNKLVRKAIAHAINKKEITEVLMLGYASPVYTFVYHGYEKWVNKDVPKYEFDLEKAKELLEQAGLKDVDGDGIRETPDGKDVELTILTPSYDPVRVRIGDLMVEWFKEIGIKLTNRPVDFDTLIDLVYNQMNFQLYIIENDAQFEPWHLGSYYASWQHKPGGNNPWGRVDFDVYWKVLC